MVTTDTAVEQLIAIRRVARSLNVAPGTIARMSARGDFPKPVALGLRKTQYLLSDIEAWWRTRLGGMNGRAFPLAPETADDSSDGPRRVDPPPPVLRRKHRPQHR